MTTATTTERTPKTAWSRHRWTTAEFDALLAGGYLREGTKTFLWDGEIIEPMPENLPHAHAQDNLQHLLTERLPRDSWTITPAHPLILRDGYKPQPDLVVLKGPRSAYRVHVPDSADAALVIEVADSSYPQDLGEKLPGYALAGVARYWIVNLRGRRIEAYSQPEDDRYAVRLDYALDAAIPLLLDRDGEVMALGEIPVLDVLRDSLDETPPPA